MGPYCQADFANLFVAARSDADTSAATRAAHTLKGVAGNIGAKGVQQAAAELEQACKAGAGAQEIDALLTSTLTQLEPVIAGLKTFGQAAAPTTAIGTSVVADPARVNTALAHLADLLKNGDVDADKVLYELKAMTIGTPLAAALDRVSLAMSNFDFDAALQALPDCTDVANLRGFSWRREIRHFRSDRANSLRDGENIHFDF